MLDDVDEFSFSDPDVRVGTQFATQSRFRCITGTSGEPEENSDKLVDLVSCNIYVISTSDTIANILDLQKF
jgi:hypothetical protein